MHYSRKSLVAMRTASLVFFGREWRKGDQQDSLQAFRPVVQAIPHMEMDLAAEKKKSEYQDDSGNFSEALWQNRWERLNKMEIWRAIGKEDYGGRGRK